MNVACLGCALQCSQVPCTTAVEEMQAQDLKGEHGIYFLPASREGAESVKAGVDCTAGECSFISTHLGEAAHVTGCHDGAAQCTRPHLQTAHTATRERERRVTAGSKGKAQAEERSRA